MTSSVLRVLVSLLLLIGLQQLGSALLIHAKAGLAPLLLERAWTQSLQRGGQPVKPWPWADTWPVARLVVPALRQSHLVLAGDSGNALAFGPGHHSASALPGANGLTLIGGHRDTHFNFLRDMHLGQRVALQSMSGDFSYYRVRAIDIVDASKGGIVARHGSNRLMLVTCYPFDAILSGGPLRYRVIAERETGSPVPGLPGRGDQFML
mgnify:FL=1